MEYVKGAQVGPKIDRDRGDEHSKITIHASMYMMTPATRILDELRTFLSEDGPSRPIVWEEVHAAARSLPLGETPGPDGITCEVLRLAGIGFEITRQTSFWSPGVPPGRTSIVWRGRAPGLYYRWYDIYKSVAGLKDPTYKGFDPFEEAVGALYASALAAD